MESISNLFGKVGRRTANKTHSYISSSFHYCSFWFSLSSSCVFWFSLSSSCVWRMMFTSSTFHLLLLLPLLLLFTSSPSSTLLLLFILPFHFFSSSLITIINYNNYNNNNNYNNYNIIQRNILHCKDWYTLGKGHSITVLFHFFVKLDKHLVFFSFLVYL